MAAEEDDDSHIIASVRRILGEDASRPRAAHGGAAAAPDVYELEPSMMIEPHGAGGSRGDVPKPAPEPVPDEGELSSELAAWASEWGDEEETEAPHSPTSEDVSVVPQAAPMLAAQQEEARPAPPPPEPVRPAPAEPETTALRVAPPPAPVEPALVAPSDSIAGIVEPQTANAAGHAFGSLRDTLRARKDAAVSAAIPAAVAISSHAGGPTIEEMIRQELRPLLKSWLDAELPGLVERVVRDEIARIVEQAGD